MIESLQSPHVVRVKALLSSKKDRQEQSLFIAEGLQSVREAIKIRNSIETLYLTHSGSERLSKVGLDVSYVNLVSISEKVADAMSDAITSQGIIAICRIPKNELEEHSSDLSDKHIVYLNEIQDPGNAGTILRSADAMAIGAVITSQGSVDFYSAKVVRSTAGSLWHIPLLQGISLDQLRIKLPNHDCYLLTGNGEQDINTLNFSAPAIWIFGNEARGVQEEISGTKKISIPMPGNAESLNLAAAASIVMYQISRGK
jgi:TrmH family RNA methyltransferase